MERKGEKKFDCVCVYMFINMCACERKRDGERQRQGERKRE